MLMYWEDERLNRPDRLEHYIMMLACQVGRLLSNHPNLIQPHHFKLTFSRGPIKLSPEEEKKHLEYMKAMRGASLGGMKRMTIVDRDGRIIKKPEAPARKGLRPSSSRGPMAREQAVQVMDKFRGGGVNADSSGVGGAGNQVHSGREGSEDAAKGSRVITPTHGRRRRRL